jgi:hypothetical protein
LGEFSPIGSIAFFGQFFYLKITEAAQISGFFFPRQSYSFILGLDTFWAIVSRTHLVTLGANPTTFEFTAATPKL